MPQIITGIVILIVGVIVLRTRLSTAVHSFFVALIVGIIIFRSGLSSASSSASSSARVVRGDEVF